MTLTDVAKMSDAEYAVHDRRLARNYKICVRVVAPAFIAVVAWLLATL